LGQVAVLAVEIRDRALKFVFLFVFHERLYVRATSLLVPPAAGMYAFCT